MQFKLREMFVVGTMFCIATAAIVAVPDIYFLFPVGLTTMAFLLIGQRKVALTFASCFLVSWLIVSAAELINRQS